MRIEKGPDKKMKVFVTGADGQLGCDVLNELNKRGHEITASDIGEIFSHPYLYVPLDITDKETVIKVLKESSPDAVIHCAAYTAVDMAEEDADAAYSINAQGTSNIAEAVKDLDSKMLYVSTDYVFDGTGRLPWDPDCIDYHPLNVYGRSKLEGEKAVSSLLNKYFIVRTSWVFGVNGSNFVKTMLKAAKTHDTVRVVNDQTGTPTYTKDLAVLLSDMIETDRYGYYHATNSEEHEGGYISWYDFTREIYRQAGLDTKVIPVSTEEYGLSVARRPLNSRLDKSKLKREGFTPLPDWKDALARYLKESGYGD